MASKIDLSAVEGLAELVDGVPTSGEIEAMIAAAVASATAGLSGGNEVGDYIWSAASSRPKSLLCNGAAISRTTYSALFAKIGTRFGAGDGSTTFNLPAPGGRTFVAAGTGTVVEAIAAAAVNATTDVITVASNAEKWITGRKVRISTTTTLPGGLVAATDYYVIRDSATAIRLASSLANAIAGTAINITTAGTGTHTLTHTLTARALGDLGGEETHALTVDEIPAHAHNETNLGGSGGSDYQPGGAQNPANPIPTSSTGGSGAHNNMQPYQVENLFIYAGV